MEAEASDDQRLLFYVVDKKDMHVGVLPCLMLYGLLVLVFIYFNLKSAQSYFRIKRYAMKTQLIREQGPIMGPVYYGSEPAYVKEQVEELNARYAAQSQASNESATAATPNSKEKV